MISWKSRTVFAFAVAAGAASALGVIASCGGEPGVDPEGPGGGADAEGGVALGPPEAGTVDPVVDGGARDGAPLDPLCEELRARGIASGCADEKSVIACGQILGCASFRRDLPREMYRCALDRPDYCAGALKQCQEKVARAHASDRAYVAYRDTCLAHHGRCDEAGTPFKIDVCATPYDDDTAIIIFANEPTLVEMSKCFDGTCGEKRTCAFAAYGCR